mmetsp:Transcript_20761/g.64566  ORF Transcript_20761/g.64566 Transcript_20761/m.64566 type:complete len:126 (-) Transcript_20761:317-694(-)
MGRTFARWEMQLRSIWRLHRQHTSGRGSIVLSREALRFLDDAEAAASAGWVAHEDFDNQFVTARHRGGGDIISWHVRYRHDHSEVELAYPSVAAATSAAAMAVAARKQGDDEFLVYVCNPRTHVW